jgi:Flp pilus assembly pilin Flp
MLRNTKRQLPLWGERNEEGQALVEYTLILMLVAVVAVGILTQIGEAVVPALSGVLAGF